MASTNLGKVSVTPKGEWDDQVDYEKLDIVFDSNSGTSYIAVQDVPAETLLTDTDYWLELIGPHNHDGRYYTSYHTSQTVSVASSAQIMRIPSSGTDDKITTDTVVLSCVFANPQRIASNVTWQSYAGYVTFTGTCTTATTADVILGTKVN